MQWCGQVYAVTDRDVAVTAGTYTCTQCAHAIYSMHSDSKETVLGLRKQIDSKTTPPEFCFPCQVSHMLPMEPPKVCLKLHFPFTTFGSSSCRVVAQNNAAILPMFCIHRLIEKCGRHNMDTCYFFINNAVTSCLHCLSVRSELFYASEPLVLLQSYAYTMHMQSSKMQSCPIWPLS